MCTLDEMWDLQKTFHKYEKGRFVEEEDIQAVKRLNKANLLTLSFKDKRPYAASASLETRGYHVL